MSAKEMMHMLLPSKFIPKYWIIVTNIHQDSHDNLVGYLDYDIGEDKGDPRINFGRALADLLLLS